MLFNTSDHKTRWVNYLVSCCEIAFKEANKGKWLLPGEILSMEGMSGSKTRRFYNHLCSNYGFRHYLEVGSWKGSSTVAALYKNHHVKGTSIDNWSEFNGPIDDFYENVNRFLSPGQLKTVNKDCWLVGNDDIDQPIDIFLYDGGHTYELQKRAIEEFARFLAKFSVVLVDDWTCDWAQVREGTLDGFKSTPALKIHHTREVGLVGTKMHHTGGETFWNGIGIFVVERMDI